MIGYFISTIDVKNDTIFNHDDGRLRNKLNIELKETYYIIKLRK